MPPVGVGVNLAMLDASDVAMALCAQPDAISALREAEALVCERARALMPDAIEGSSAGSLPTRLLTAVADRFTGNRPVAAVPRSCECGAGFSARIPGA